MGGVTAAQIQDAILKTWNPDTPNPHYLVAWECNNGAGFSYGRTLDAVVIDTWPSKGLQVHGIEIKVSKSDLRRELQDPTKALAFVEHVDLFSIAAPAGIVDLQLLPAKWGLYCLTDDGTLRARRKPIPLHASDPQRPKVLNRSFAVALMRALNARSTSGAALEKAHQRGVDEGVQSEANRQQHMKRELEWSQKLLTDFEQETGVKLADRWGQGVSPAAIGKAVRFTQRGTLDPKYGESLHHFAKRLESLACDLDELQAELQEQEK